MVQNIQIVKAELNSYINQEKAEFLPKFFQAYSGGYGEGDKFIGVTVPNLRKVAKKYYQNMELAEIEQLLHEPHKHDLIQKAVGWMLREIGNRDFAAEFNFLKDNYQQMPRTMLRYAIEKFEEGLRQQFLKGLV